jgi:dihydroorotase
MINLKKFGKKEINMGIYLRNGNVFNGRQWEKRDVILEGGRIAALMPSGQGFLESDSVLEDLSIKYERVIDCDNSFLLPGFVDVHVHLREPGYEYKETIATGTKAGAAGGYTLLCAMPNVNPAPSTLAALEVQLEAIQKDGVIPVIPYGTITVQRDGTSTLSDMDAMAPFVAGFSDDGTGVQVGERMEEAMKKAASLDKVIAAHCEDEELSAAGDFRKSEWVQVARDLDLCKKTRCNYHVCHVSTKESLHLIREAKQAGLHVTCETAPHYLIFCEEDREDDGRFKMNPPLMGKEDRRALIEGLADGTIDMIATDHAPHSREEKSKGFAGSANGVVGLETAFPVLYTQLVLTGKVPLERLLDAMVVAPRRRFGLPGGKLEPGQSADLCIWDLEKSYTMDPATFYSKGKSTPFQGMEVVGKNKYTIVEGVVVWER